MNLVITFPDTYFTDFVFSVHEGSVADDVLKAAEEEWNINTDVVSITHDGVPLELSSKLMNRGLQEDATLALKQAADKVYTSFDLSNSYQEVEDFFKKNPEKCCYMNAETLTEGSDLELKLLNVPRIAFINAGSVKGIRNKFLFNCYQVLSVDLSSLHSITRIGDNFANGCRRLTRLDISSSKGISSIGEYFLGNCSALESVSLDLPSLESIDERFLLNSGIRELDLSSLVKLTSIGSDFLRGSSVKKVILPDNITEIDKGFLCRCSSLCSIDLKPLSRITILPQNFLCCCPSLVGLDLTPLSEVVEIQSLVLSECDSILSIDLSPLVNVLEVKEGLLRGSEWISHLQIKRFYDEVRKRTSSANR